MTTKKIYKNMQITKKRYLSKRLKKRKTFSGGLFPDSQPVKDSATDPQTGPPTGQTDPAGQDIQSQLTPQVVDDDIVSGASSSSASLQQELANCHIYSLSCYLQNQDLTRQLFKLKFPNIAPYDYQVRSAPNIPYIKPENLYQQIKQIEDFIRTFKLTQEIINGLNEGKTLNSLVTEGEKIQPTLRLVGIVDRIEPGLFKPVTRNAFLKVEVKPPDDEELFSAIDQNNGQPVPMKYPAVLFIRCRIDKDGTIELRGVYLITSSTAIVNDMDDNILVSNPAYTLIGLLKIESQPKYEARRLKETHMVLGKSYNFDLKIDGIITEMKFKGPPDQVQKLADAFRIEQHKIPDEIVRARRQAMTDKKAHEISEDPTDLDIYRQPEISIEDTNAIKDYSITRFHISGNTKEQIVKNFFKGILTSAPSVRDLVKPTGVVAAKAAGLEVAKLAKFFGGKRKNMKNTMNKIKNINKRNTKKYRYKK